MNSSIMSFEDRGPWGQASWPGNCSGHIYRTLFEQLKPRDFADPMAGSGTSIEVAREMGITAYGFDIHRGFNAVKDSIVEAVGHEVDVCLSHPPYGDIVLYADDKDDLSRCSSDAVFHDQLQLVMMNQREATRAGKIYGCIIGDKRRNGIYVNYMAELICRMPSDELTGVLIKAQHNCVSDAKSYAGLKMPRIAHEYIVLFRKKEKPLLMLLAGIAKEQQARLSGTWKNIVRMVMINSGGKASLAALYSAIEVNAPEKIANNPNWREKIRQTVNANSNMFAAESRGVWKLV
jgi:hypothetical protein